MGSRLLHTSRKSHLQVIQAHLAFRADLLVLLVQWLLEVLGVQEPLDFLVSLMVLVHLEVLCFQAEASRGNGVLLC